MKIEADSHAMIKRVEALSVGATADEMEVLNMLRAMANESLKDSNSKLHR